MIKMTWFAVWIGFAQLCCADTIVLNSGQQVQVTVTKYGNGAFEARSENGKTATYPSNAVKRIEFAARTTPSKLKTRNNGMQEGTVTSFANGGFVVNQANGTKTFPAIFVEQVAFVADRGQGIQLISKGQPVDIKQHLAMGNVTVVEFYADWCGPCRKLSPVLEKLAQDAEVAVRKIDIINWQSPVAQQYHIEGLPHVEVYGRKGELIGEVQGVDAEALLKYVAKAKSG